MLSYLNKKNIVLMSVCILLVFIFLTSIFGSTKKVEKPEWIIVYECGYIEKYNDYDLLLEKVGNNYIIDLLLKDETIEFDLKKQENKHRSRVDMCICDYHESRAILYRIK